MATQSTPRSDILSNEVPSNGWKIVKTPRRPEFRAEREILTPAALSFVAGLERAFRTRRERLLEARQVRRERWRRELPDFSQATRTIREGKWAGAPIVHDLRDRRVEITGPVDRKMIINALNSGARVFMADFEDSHAPTWQATVDGQLHLKDAVRGQISYTNPEGREYRLNPEVATLVVRPRGWHLQERHFKVDGEVASASLFDFGLYFYHNAKELLARGTGPFFYIPKMESAEEARLWNDVFVHAQEILGIPKGTIRATVLIETLPAAFEMEEILYELRDHVAGLNCGRWDYIFSFIKELGDRPEFVLPDRALVTMEAPFLSAYARRLIWSCHRRGVHAMGGMAAQIPIRGDEAANARAIEKVRADKRREVGLGHDGTWVAHPALVPVAREIFDRGMTSSHQLGRIDDASGKITAGDLLRVAPGEVTARGVRVNARVALRYLASWLGGLGCVPIDHLMEDAATAEISRAQLWQWIRHGRTTREEFEGALEAELALLPGEARAAGAVGRVSSELIREMVLAERMPDFLTLLAYDRI